MILLKNEESGYTFQNNKIIRISIDITLLLIKSSHLNPVVNMNSVFTSIRLHSLEFHIDRLKPILKLQRNPYPYPTPNPPPPNPGNNFFSAISCQIPLKLSGYLPDHLPTWSMMSKITLSFKSPVKNPQRPPSPQWRPDHL